MKGLCKIALAVFALLVFVPGHAQAGGKTLKIDPGHVVGVQNMRSEITSMLESLGYELQSVRDPATGQPVLVSKKFGQYRMLFRVADNASVQVEVHIRNNDNVTGLHFSEVGADQPGEAALDHYHRLRERVVFEFGADNVSDGHSFTTP